MTDSTSETPKNPILNAACREIVLFPDRILKQKCISIKTMDDRLDKLIDDMLYTMYEAPGIGLAAPQIGILERLFVYDVSKDNSKPQAVINPQIIQSTGEILMEEGCLSIPGVYADITRPAHIIVKGMDRDGKNIEFEASDLEAVCIQHEIDHLNGKLFIDYLSQMKRTRMISEMKRILSEKTADKTADKGEI